MFGIGIQEIFLSFLVASVIFLIIIAVTKGGKNYPTWTGIIISAIFGLLGLYLVLCFFGIMGEERYQDKK